MSAVPGLRSPYAKVGRLVYFGRMLDKIRLQAAGKLPADYQENFGDHQPTVFDSRCCRFLGLKHADIQRRTLAGGSDEEILSWCQAEGAKRTDEECEIWNAFMIKRGWRDAAAARLKQRLAEHGGLDGQPVLTMFDFIDYDEGRPSAAERPWEKV